MSLHPSRKWEPLAHYTTDSSGVEEWVNDLYVVGVRRFKDGWPLGDGEWALLTVCLLDGSARHDWREFQRIKNELVGPEWEAVELYPAEGRLRDPSNMFALWCAPKIPLGWFGGRVVQGPENSLAPQRGWAKGDEPKEVAR